ncbi:ArnT family glycosyltransferase [Dactylosporangium cerinum]|uniref:ArnT family glycosyltransferase n=1 Tax=Dactylosporangium cerinum TaxID=1434730 RepID=A0ABV9W2G5_9ACTN
MSAPVLYDLELPPLDIDLGDPPPPPAGRRRRQLRAAVAWLREHRWDALIVAVLTVVGGVVHAVGMNRSPARFDDEGTYTAYAWAVQHLGHLGHYTYWYAHPPLGWLQIAAYNVLTGAPDRAPYAIASTRELMLVCKLISIPLLYGLARRLDFTRFGSMIAVLLFALSPLSVYFTRAALLDNIVTPWLVAAFFFAASPRRSLTAAIASGGSFAVAVLSKETALLYLPAVALLLWMRSDRRNRRFTVTMFGTCFGLLCAAYPLYALINNELLAGPGHVSIEYAVRWQLFERVGSGDIFDPKSTAHAVIQSWIDQDRWLPMLSLLLAIPGLLIRRTRAVAAAFCIQVTQMLRGGYLPYPYVIAMIPFAALTVAGVADWLFAGRLVVVPWIRDRVDSTLRAGLGSPGLRRGRQILVGAATLVLAVFVAHSWQYGLQDLRTNDRDAGKAAALRWVLDNVGRDEYLVVDDAFWVDLVEAGYPRSHVIWFTKLDVDKDVQLPGSPQWASIDYVLLDHQDDLSVHLQADGQPSKDTLNLFPTLGKALQHSHPVVTFGTGLDTVAVRAVDPGASVKKAGG